MYFNSAFYNKTWTVNHPCTLFLNISLRLGIELIIYIILLATKLFKCIFHLQVERSLDIGGFMVIINKSCSREQHTQHIDARGNLTFCGVWTPIPSLDQDHYFGFFIYFFPFEENVIPIMIFPLTSTPLWLFYLHPSPPPSPLLYPPYATTEARQVPGLIREDGQKKWRRRETERGEGNWERHQKRVRKITENKLCWWPEKKKSWSQPTLTISYSQGTKWQLVGQLVTI